MITVGCFIFEDMTALDIVWPYEALTGLPNIQTILVAASAEPVRAEGSMRIVPDCTFASAPALDVLIIPGGSGINRIMEDNLWMNFLTGRAAEAQWITSVCTGALVLGAAGLLRGYRATTHWLSLDLLVKFGAVPCPQRVVVDRNRVTGGGVTAGIDVGLALAAMIVGATTARERQLLLQYNLQPPFPDNNPDSADANIAQAVRVARSGIQQARLEIIDRITRRAAGTHQT